MPNDPGENVPSWPDDSVIRADDLNALAHWVRYTGRYFADTKREGNATAVFYPFPGIIGFPAIVMNSGTDGLRCLVAQAITDGSIAPSDVYNAYIDGLANLGPDYVPQGLVATNLANLPTLTNPGSKRGGTAPTQGGPMPPVNTIVLCFQLYSRSDSVVAPDRPQPSAPISSCVFWWTPPPPVTVRIASAISGAGGKYSGTIQIGTVTDDGLIDLILPQGQTDGPSCLVENGDEDGQPTHWLEINSYANGFVVGISFEEPPRPIVRLIRGQYQTSGGPTLTTGTDTSPDPSTWTAANTASGTNYGNSSLTVQVQTASFWDSTTGTLSYNYRAFTFAADGRLVSVSGETNQLIDTTVACS